MLLVTAVINHETNVVEFWKKDVVCGSPMPSGKRNKKNKRRLNQGGEKMKKRWIFLAVMVATLIATCAVANIPPAVAESSKKENMAWNTAERVVNEFCYEIEMHITERDILLDRVIEQEELLSREMETKDNKKISQVLFKMRIAIENEIEILENLQREILRRWSMEEEKNFNMEEFVNKIREEVKKTNGEIETLQNRLGGLLFDLKYLLIKRKMSR